MHLLLTFYIFYAKIYRSRINSTSTKESVVTRLIYPFYLLLLFMFMVVGIMRNLSIWPRYLPIIEDLVTLVVLGFIFVCTIIWRKANR